MHFETRNTEDHLDARLSEPLRPCDISLLIESRSELHHNTHTFAVVLRVNQRIHYLRITCHSVKTNANRRHRWVNRGGF